MASSASIKRAKVCVNVLIVNAINTGLCLKQLLKNDTLHPLCTSVGDEDARLELSLIHI